MAKYILMWQMDTSKFPADPKEAIAMNMKMLETCKQILKEGVGRDWGCFLGGNNGYAIGEGDAADMAKATWQFTPYVRFEVQQVLSVDEVIDINKSMMQ